MEGSNLKLFIKNTFGGIFKSRVECFNLILNEIQRFDLQLCS